MRLQLALDGTLPDSVSILQGVHPYIDIAEIGTPLIYREGMAAVRRLRQTFPSLTLLADLKIMDAGEEEAAIAFGAGCTLVTVLGVTQEATLRGSLSAARRFSGQIMVDMMQVPDLIPRARQYLVMGCHYLCVHTAHDLQAADVTPLEHLRQLRRELPNAPLAVAGGIKPETLDSVAALRPAIVIVGSAITGSSDPAKTAGAVREKIDAYANL